MFNKRYRKKRKDIEKMKNKIVETLNVYPEEIKVVYRQKNENKKESHIDNMNSVVSVRYLLEYDVPKYKKILKEKFGYKGNVQDLELALIKVNFEGKEYTILTHQDGDPDDKPVFIDETGKNIKNKGLEKWFKLFMDEENREIFPITEKSFHHIGKKITKEKVVKKLVKGLKRYFGENKPEQEEIAQVLEWWIDRDEDFEYFAHLLTDDDENLNEQYYQIISLFNGETVSEDT